MPLGWSDAFRVALEALACVALERARTVEHGFAQERVVILAAVLIGPRVEVQAYNRHIRGLERGKPVELLTQRCGKRGSGFLHARGCRKACARGRAGGVAPRALGRCPWRRAQVDL